MGLLLSDMQTMSQNLENCEFPQIPSLLLRWDS